MARARGGQGEELADKRAVLDAMGHCRNALLRAQSTVQPFGTTYRVLQLVTHTIDLAAYYLTGESGFYASDGSSAMPGRIRWER